MEFKVSRTSGHEDQKPCEGAESHSYVRVDERTTDDPATIPMYGGKTEQWYGEGRNHRVVNGRIRRDFDETAWFIEFGSLYELCLFIVTNGECVLSMYPENNGIPELEIYDNRRE